MTTMTDEQRLLEQAQSLTRDWVEKMVVGLNLCPFAAPVVRAGTIRYQVSYARDEDNFLRDFLQQLSDLVETPEAELSTTLLITPWLLADFEDFLDLVEDAEALIERAGVEDLFQIATFHPGYLFDGVDEDDISHWTNRAPYPALHLIRQDEMSRALASYRDPESIPERNIARLKEMGKAGLLAQFPPLADYWPE
ncbi:hypothetical protein ADIMK_3311 [Marinobacterium lacunae]|uniref:DUF1415 domain-containing protein n=1 Tax=Marinobacterium lacunae TaxID=1232683 RepID=A0A081FV65_9GAMM|nr:DUF1415 domain-containing protein [Marinobacterium lacunae]KEA62420.1 hypothetical protein ADIMK_3311 [Marinobacterium lacunae]MBR9884435.1 DUF1415 domain-containing protein [Oceanospirillales bacterium]